jgi:hypothetical protein
MIYLTTWLLPAGQKMFKGNVTAYSIFHSEPRAGSATQTVAYSLHNTPQEAVLGKNGGIIIREENRKSQIQT